MIFAHLWSKELPNNLGNIHERPPYTNKAAPRKGEDMFCVIQEVTIKRIPKGEPKRIVNLSSQKVDSFNELFMREYNKGLFLFGILTN